MQCSSLAFLPWDRSEQNPRELAGGKLERRSCHEVVSCTPFQIAELLALPAAHSAAGSWSWHARERQRLQSVRWRRGSCFPLVCAERAATCVQLIAANSGSSLLIVPIVSQSLRVDGPTASVLQTTVICGSERTFKPLLILGRRFRSSLSDQQLQ